MWLVSGLVYDVAPDWLRSSYHQHDPRKNALLKEGNKSDKLDARKLTDLLGGYLHSVYPSFDTAP